MMYLYEARGSHFHNQGSELCVCVGDEVVVGVNHMVRFWQSMLSGQLTKLVQNADQTNLRSVGCDCLASIGPRVFEQLPRDKQILIITLLFGCSRDETTNVRSSAVRALAICVHFPTLREDIHFVIDTGESVMRALSDECVGLRVKASWSMGNFCEVLVLNKLEGTTEDIPDALLLQLLDCVIKATQDNEKVKANAVRAVGNLLELLNQDQLAQQVFQEATNQAIASLVQNAKTSSIMKVRWNACYAIGLMMKNEYLYMDSASWQSVVFPVLSELVQGFHNFKVRINAAATLAVPTTRKQYGGHYLSLWTALLKGLENSQNMEDFTEYKHRDNLVDQICLTLTHLASLVTRDDLRPLQDVLVFHQDMMQHHLHSFRQRIVPEKAACLVMAADHTTSILQQQGLVGDQHAAATLLSSIFMQDSDFLLS